MKYLIVIVEKKKNKFEEGTSWFQKIYILRTTRGTKRGGLPKNIILISHSLLGR